jgi:hypothetical protein
MRDEVNDPNINKHNPKKNMKDETRTAYACISGIAAWLVTIGQVAYISIPRIDPANMIAVISVLLGVSLVSGTLAVIARGIES